MSADQHLEYHMSISAHKIIENMEEAISKRAFDHSILKDTHSFLADAIKKAAKFSTTLSSDDDWQVLGMTGREYVEAGFYAPPFDYCYYEATVPDQKIVCMATPWTDFNRATGNRYDDETADVALFCFRDFGPPTGWFHSSMVVLWKYDHAKTAAKRWTIGKISMFEGTGIADPLGGSEAHALNDQQSTVSATCVYQALLHAKGISVDETLPDDKLSRSRAKKGKLPLLTYHTVTIGGISSEGNIVGKGMSHASPRAHWRRGHVRTLHRGEPDEKKTAIPACYINGRGFVGKEYAVKN